MQLQHTRTQLHGNIKILEGATMPYASSKIMLCTCYGATLLHMPCHAVQC